MAFKRLTQLECDGPCGTTLESGKLPADWSRANIKAAKKPAKKAVLCPKCTEAAVAALGHAKINLTDGLQRKEKA